MEDLKSLVGILTADGGSIAMFIVFVAGLMRQWWVMGVSFRAACDERDRAIANERLWREAALNERHLAARALDAATP